jgi:arylsulfatase A
LGQEQPQHEYLYWEFHEQGGKQAIRMRDWKGIQLDVFTQNPQTLLYNLATDPMENEDLSKEHPEIVVEIKQIMDSARVEDPGWPFKPQ